MLAAKVKWFCKGHGSVFLSVPTSALLSLPTPLLLYTLPSCSHCVTPERCWWYITRLQPRCNMWCLSLLRGVSSTGGFVAAISQRHSHNNSVSRPHSEKENTVMKLFPWRFYVQICACSDYGNIKQPAPLSLPLCTLIATLSQLLHINVLHAVPFCGYPWSMHASTYRTEILDAGAELWVVLKDFSDGDSWMSCRSLEKKMCAMMEGAVCSQDDTVASQCRWRCRRQECCVSQMNVLFTCPEPDPKSWLTWTHPTWLKQKLWRVEKCGDSENPARMCCLYDLYRFGNPAIFKIIVQY